MPKRHSHEQGPVRPIMSRIALCHFRVGETDGVSLEMGKWRQVLERLGHEVV